MLHLEKNIVILISRFPKKVRFPFGHGTFVCNLIKSPQVNSYSLSPSNLASCTICHLNNTLMSLSHAWYVAKCFLPDAHEMKNCNPRLNLFSLDFELLPRMGHLHQPGSNIVHLSTLITSHLSSYPFISFNNPFLCELPHRSSSA